MELEIGEFGVKNLAEIDCFGDDSSRARHGSRWTWVAGIKFHAEFNLTVGVWLLVGRSFWPGQNDLNTPAISWFLFAGRVIAIAGDDSLIGYAGFLGGRHVLLSLGLPFLVFTPVLIAFRLLLRRFDLNSASFVACEQDFNEMFAFHRVVPLRFVIDAEFVQVDRVGSLLGYSG